MYRHLAERAWRKDGPLAILVRQHLSLLDKFVNQTLLTGPSAFAGDQMQRVTQMSVTPDLLAEINPEADVQIRIAGNHIEPGSYTLPSQVRAHNSALFGNWQQANSGFVWGSYRRLTGSRCRPRCSIPTSASTRSSSSIPTSPTRPPRPSRPSPTGLCTCPRTLGPRVPEPDPCFTR